MKLLAPLFLIALPLSLAFAVPARGSNASAPPVATAPVHCQVPCGIYGDKLRIDMLMEDLATIAKAMDNISVLESLKDAGDRNQLVRWVMAKDEHAQSIQDQVSAYWLAQRIKAPQEESVEAQEKYHRQLAILHGITVQAMKCKQTAKEEFVANARRLVLDLSAAYFSKEDLAHIRSHYAGDEK